MDKMMLEMDHYVKNANQVKETVLLKLLEDKYINNEQHEHLSNNYHVVIVKRSWLEGWFNRLKGTNDGYIYKFVKF